MTDGQHQANLIRTNKSPYLPELRTGVWRRPRVTDEAGDSLGR